MQRKYWLVVAMLFSTAAPVVAQQAAAPPAEPVALPPWADPALDPLTATRLERFDSEAAFQQWADALGDARELWERRRFPGAAPLDGQLAQDATAAAEPPACPPEAPACDVAVVEESEHDIVLTPTVAVTAVTADAAVTSAPNITNVQNVGVDEGDVVKQIGDFLVVLQDGRLFSVDTRGGSLSLADRIDVYRDADDDGWYDEMLVQGNRLIITSYSYDERATEFSVFELNEQTGRMARLGSFLISSGDYYSGDNYASRIIGDTLVIYTPYDVDALTDDAGRPRIRRWMREEARNHYVRRRGDSPEDGGRPMFDASGIYRPLLRTINPVVHSVTICPLASYSGQSDVPDCRTTGFVAPEARETMVTSDAIYLWTGADWYDRQAPVPIGPGGDTCPGRAVTYDDMPPAVIYRIPVNGGQPSVVGVRGYTFNQFSMDASDQRFRAILDWRFTDCNDAGRAHEPVFVDIGLDEFSSRPVDIGAARHIPLPRVEADSVENRFAGHWLVYGGRAHGYGAVPDPAEHDGDEVFEAHPTRPVFVIPVDNPTHPQRIDLPHNVIRIDRVGADRMIVNGYRDKDALSISLLQLGDAPNRLDTVRLVGRYESEGRSHAFNSLIAEDRSGLMGIPTVQRRADAERYEWWSEGSDVSFLSVASDGRIGDAGPLQRGDDTPAAGYRCEVSCVDWYGNSRPIFTGGRIFALLETEIAEGRMEGGQIREIGRVDLTARPPRHPRDRSRDD
ncbi:MAG: beta-propeller domain-containing protein [Sphingomonadaceae bacterium]|nr:beta-propeller domain-containing protein [Sphingomonadaceae bacterium]